MSNSLAKKFDKIVSKLANNKSKDIKLNEHDLTDYSYYHDDTPTNGNEELQQEKFIQRIKYHLGHTNKTEHNQQSE
ncbi:unnamed protein product, partial [Rotaria sordida]